VSWIIFLAALFLPVNELLSIDSAILGSFTLTVPLIIIFIARSLDGLTGGNISVANAYLSDITEEKDRSSNFGKMSVSSNLGFIIGPALAGLLGATVLGETLPVLAALLISGLAIVIIKVYLPESKSSSINKIPENLSVRKVFGQEHKECYKVKNRQTLKLKDIIKLKNIPFLLVLYFLIFLGFNIFYAAFPVHAIKHLKWSVTQMGVFFSILSFMMIVVQGPVLSRLSIKISDRWLIIAGSIILGINFLLLIKGDVVLTYVAALFFAVGNGIMWPSFLSILSKTAGERHQGAVQGFASSSGSLASIIGLIIGGLLYEQIGNMAFLISAIVIFLVFIMSFRIRTFE
jgi:MFS family permease